MQTTIKFRCQQCDTGLASDRESVGLSCACPNCSAVLIVPTPTALVRVDESIEECEMFDMDTGLVDYARPSRIPQRGVTPVELRMPGELGSLKAEVDQPTSNALVTTFLGGALVATGAVLFAMFGGKGKSV